MTYLLGVASNVTDLDLFWYFDKSSLRFLRCTFRCELAILYRWYFCVSMRWINIANYSVSLTVSWLHEFLIFLFPMKLRYMCQKSARKVPDFCQTALSLGLPNKLQRCSGGSKWRIKTLHINRTNFASIYRTSVYLNWSHVPYFPTH